MATLPPLWVIMFGDSDADHFEVVTYGEKLIASRYGKTGRWPGAPCPRVAAGVLPRKNLAPSAAGSMLMAICPLCHSLNAFLPEILRHSSTYLHRCTAWNQSAPCPGFWVVLRKREATCFLQ